MEAEIIKTAISEGIKEGMSAQHNIPSVAAYQHITIEQLDSGFLLSHNKDQKHSRVFCEDKSKILEVISNVI